MPTDTQVRAVVLDEALRLRGERSAQWHDTVPACMHDDLAPATGILVALCIVAAVVGVIAVTAALI